MKRITVCGTVITALLLAALVCMPAIAAGTEYPVLDNEVATRQAHLRWQGAIMETEMSTAVTYTGALNGTSTQQMSSLLATFQGQEAQISTMTTHAGLNNLLRQMQETVRKFLDEAKVQMRAGKGRWGELQSQMKAAVDSNPNIESLKNGYWSTRNTNELANFDTRVQRAQSVIDALKAKAYDTTTPQATLDAIRAKRSALEAALAAQDNNQIRTINQEIYQLSQQLVQQVKDLQVSIPDKTIVKYYIDLGNRATARADMINNDLKALGIDTSAAEQALTSAKGHLSEAQAALDAGNIAGAQDALHKVKEDFRNLAQAYRDIAHAGSLSSDMTTTLNSMATTLDQTADRMEV
jgi:hypothetical protein